MRVIAITPGDPGGIGPEITWRAIQAHHASGDESSVVFCVGARAPFDRLKVPVFTLPATDIRRGAIEALRRHGAASDPFVLLVEPPRRPAPGPFFRPKKGKAVNLPGYQSGWSIAYATELALKGVADAIVTGPISKERLQAGGYAFPGHTEFLAALCKTRDVTMMLANDKLRIALVTTHLALKDVPRAITRRELRRTIQHTVAFLKQDSGVPTPRIAIAALNPHAGENGLFGKEEQRIIGPEILKLTKTKVFGDTTLIGPLPADTLFVKHATVAHYDAVVCMYHDQGLIPVKLLDFPQTVNVSLGLPIVRTSVDHGVAFDLVGKGIADPTSMISAIRLAERIIATRRRTTKEKAS